MGETVAPVPESGEPQRIYHQHGGEFVEMERTRDDGERLTVYTCDCGYSLRSNPPAVV